MSTATARLDRNQEPEGQPRYDQDHKQDPHTTVGWVQFKEF